MVVWDSHGFDILFNFEELRFANKTVTVASIQGTGTSDFLDDPDSTQS